jgi:hypothetical protein
MPAVIWRTALTSDTVACTPGAAAAPGQAVGQDQLVAQAAFGAVLIITANRSLDSA